MRHSLSPLLTLVGLTLLATGCATQRDVLTRAERDSYAPDQVRLAAKGLYPKVVILSCIDSRVPVEDVFDRGIGDVFVARVAGNFENTDILRTIEYGCKVAGSKVVMVLGHGACGAVKGAIDDVKLGNITPMLANIQPAVAHCSHYDGEKNSKNKAFVDMVVQQNVRMTVADIRAGSAIRREMEAAGKIRMIGAVYDIKTGAVHCRGLSQSAAAGLLVAGSSASMPDTPGLQRAFGQPATQRGS